MEEMWWCVHSICGKQMPFAPDRGGGLYALHAGLSLALNVRCFLGVGRSGRMGREAGSLLMPRRTDGIALGL